jgi:hypothetical protein
MLICVVSFDKEALNITIRNLYPDLELVSPVYLNTGATCRVSSSQKTDIGNTIEANFEISSEQYYFKGALLYKLQKKNAIKTGNHLNSSTAFVKDTAKNMYLWVIWDVRIYEPKFFVRLIECTNDFTWDEDRLWALYWKYNYQFRENYKSSISTWLMHDGTVMKTKHVVTYGSNYELDIIISEGTGKYDMERPIDIDPKRLVLSLLIVIILLYGISLSIQPSIKLNIHNRCLNVDLVSPTYITRNWLGCYKAPDYKVCTGDMTRSCFVIGLKNDGALIYRLQRKRSRESTEIDKDISSATQLLVIWRLSDSKELYTDVLLIKHDKGFDKDNLEKLHHKNIYRFRLYSIPVIETWLLDDNTVLMTTFEIMNGDHTLNITISEIERYNGAMAPVHIDPEE